MADSDPTPDSDKPTGEEEEDEIGTVEMDVGSVLIPLDAYGEGIATAITQVRGMVAYAEKQGGLPGDKAEAAKSILEKLNHALDAAKLAQLALVFSGHQLVELAKMVPQAVKAVDHPQRREFAKKWVAKQQKERDEHLDRLRKGLAKLTESDDDALARSVVGFAGGDPGEAY